MKDDDDDDGDEHEDERVLDHALSFLVLVLLANHELAYTQIQIAEHPVFTSFAWDELSGLSRGSFRRPPEL